MRRDLQNFEFRCFKIKYRDIPFNDKPGCMILYYNITTTLWYITTLDGGTFYVHLQKFQEK